MPPSSISERGYARPELLVDSGWLEEHLGDPQIRILDARQVPQFDEGHIPGALSVTAAGGIPRADNADMGSDEAFNELAGRLGITNDMTVVVCDTPAAMMGTVAWAFLYFGHEDVRLLDGGYEKWKREGRPLTTEAASFPATSFRSRPVEDLACPLDYAKQTHGRDGTVFWDTRTLAEYQGQAPTGANAPPRLGRIPGAVHLEWVELLDPEDKTLRPAAELLPLLSSRGITPESEIDCY